MSISSPRLSHRPLSTPAFTIVELLIVIVVIAILAAISIVAYNGIQERARVSEVSSALSQAKKKIGVWQVDNPETTPSDLATAGVSNSGNVTYQYRPGTNGVYCITATSGPTSYRISNTSSPEKGGCPGHGTGGVAAVTNYITNTSIETNTNQLANIGNATGRVIQREQVNDAYSGSYVLRVIANSSGQLAGYGATTLDTLPNGTYTGSLWVRSNTAVMISPYFEGSSTRTNNIDTGAGTLTPNTWTRLTRTFTITSPGTVKVGFLVGTNGTSSTYVDMDGIMLTSGSTLYGFADGSSSDWLWNGSPNSSTSIGPAL